MSLLCLSLSLPSPLPLVAATADYFQPAPGKLFTSFIKRLIIGSVSCLPASQPAWPGLHFKPLANLAIFGLQRTSFALSRLSFCLSPALSISQLLSPSVKIFSNEHFPQKIYFLMRIGAACWRRVPSVLLCLHGMAKMSRIRRVARHGNSHSLSPSPYVPLCTPAFCTF